MKLTKLTFADIYRDGGSYGASFDTDGGRAYNIWLARSGSPDSEGLHHRWLFEYFGDEPPRNCLPVVTGSTEEQALLARLREFLAAESVQSAAGLVPSENRKLDRLKELVGYIERREPCFPFDVKALFPSGRPPLAPPYRHK